MNFEPNEPHDQWGRPFNFNIGEIIMNLEKAYKQWQLKNPDEHYHMEKKKTFKPRTLQLWARKLKAYENRKKSKGE